MSQSEEATIIIEENDSPNQLVLANTDRPNNLYVLPVHNRPFMPAQVMPVEVSAEHWGKTIERIEHTEHKMVVLFFVDDEVGNDGTLSPSELPKTGTLAKLHQIKHEGDHIQFVAEGITRVQTAGWLSKAEPYLIEANYPQTDIADDNTQKAWAMAVISAIKELLPINPLYGEEVRQYFKRFSPNNPGPLTDFAAAITTATGEQLQEVLDQVDMQARMELVLKLLKKEIEVAKLHSEISQEVNESIDKHQREFFLREQLKVIQRELGISKDDKTADVDQFQERLHNKIVPEAAQEKIDEEMDKLSVLEPGSPEYAVTRNWLDSATSIPWGVEHEDHLDLTQASKVLDKHHAGLEDVKDRIKEFLAVGAFKGDIQGSIVCLVGPPGVGKTSIGKSIAESLGRPFYRFSVGGMRDESEIKGHRRTYIGAMPGKLVQAVKESKVMNPVIMLDEIDKMGQSYQGDPASALLETLDPEQNVNFLDHYLDLRLDLSKALFVCTANTLDSIPGPLLDRMEVIRLSGYLAEEKLAIAKKHLWPRIAKRFGFKANQISITQGALKQVIDGYARESGVRGLEKQLAKLARKSVVKLVSEETDKISIRQQEVREWLGEAPFKKERKLDGVGVITGLAWTSMGGATLPIETAIVHRNDKGLKITGQLGDVMKESANIAISYVQANAKQLGVAEDFFHNCMLHLHVPEGATPKDGPSAGVTMTSALVSLARGQTPKNNLAMTGELTLTGQVLPVGGIREKVISAKRQNITEVILPKANESDFLELPDYVKEGVTVHFAEKYTDVLKQLF